MKKIVRGLPRGGNATDKTTQKIIIVTIGKHKRLVTWTSTPHKRHQGHIINCVGADKINSMHPAQTLKANIVHQDTVPGLLTCMNNTFLTGKKRTSVRRTCMQKICTNSTQYLATVVALMNLFEDLSPAARDCVIIAKQRA